MIQKIRIDTIAYLYDGCEMFLDSFYSKLETAIKNSHNYRYFLEIEKLNDGIHMYSDIENEIEFEVDDEYCQEGSGHWNGVMNHYDFIFYLKKFIKRIDTDKVFCELEDNSDFGDSWL